MLLKFVKGACAVFFCTLFGCMTEQTMQFFNLYILTALFCCFAIFDSDMQVEEKESEEKVEFGAPSLDKAGEFSKKTDFIINMKLIENIESMEEKVFSASMQTKVSPLSNYMSYLSFNSGSSCLSEPYVRI